MRFNTSGNIDARDGGTYSGSIPWVKGASYHIRLVVNVAAHTYNVYVTPPGSLEQALGMGFAFRTEQSGVTSLDNWGLIGSPGWSHAVCDFTVTPAP